MGKELMYSFGFGIAPHNKPCGIGFNVYKNESKLFGLEFKRIIDFTSYINRRG